jgi:hypothetical protein
MDTSLVERHVEAALTRQELLELAGAEAVDRAYLEFSASSDDDMLKVMTARIQRLDPERGPERRRIKQEPVRPQPAH